MNLCQLGLVTTRAVLTQIAIAQFQAPSKIGRDGLLRDLLPGGVDKELLVTLRVWIALSQLLQGLIGRSGRITVMIGSVVYWA